MRRGNRGEFGRHRHQRPRQDVGDHQIVRRGGVDIGVARAVGDEQRHRVRGDAVQRGILARHIDRDGIDVGRDDQRVGPQFDCGKGKQAGAGADVDRAGEGLARHRQAIEHGEATAGRAVMTGAEGLPRIDQESAPPRRRRDGVRAGVDDEAAFADRLQSRLAHRDPILVAQLRDHRIVAARARHQGVDRREHRRVGLMLDIGVEPPAFDVVLDLFGGHQHGIDREIGRAVDRLRLGAGAGQGDPPARAVGLSGHRRLH